jgi:hypothetical protein
MGIIGLCRNLLEEAKVSLLRIKRLSDGKSLHFRSHNLSAHSSRSLKSVVCRPENGPHCIIDLAKFLLAGMPG